MEKHPSHSCVSLSQPLTDVSVSSMAPLPAQAPPDPASADAACMNSLVSLLDRLLMQQMQVPVKPPGMSTAPHARLDKSCRVCGSQDHSTLSHCRQDNLCLGCLTPGHFKKDCPSSAQKWNCAQYSGDPQGPGPQGNSVNRT